ncbi:hypothetical protein KFU94_32845 [Chloroflexi bacterium TSY]|nr:hypothetical protein [Chloroflexi bacterium TSY]
MRGYLHLTHQGIALARVEDGKTIELQYADALRNLMLAMESNGTVKASFLYGPFGEVLHATGQQNHRRQFNGKENDSMTTLRYYGFRYYDPLTLRWNSADPLYRVLPDIGLAEPQRLNLYSFTLNNPVNYFDPDGRDSKKSQKAKGNEPHPDKPGKCDIRVNECRQKKNEMTNKKRALRSEIRSLRKRRNDMDIQRMNTKQKLRDMEDFWKRVGDSQLHPKTWESGWELKQRYKNQGEYIKRRNNEIRQAKQELKQVERELELIDATDAVVKASENGLLSIDNSYQRSNAEVMFLILDTIGPIMR